jgi:crossover junction endonuclease MUS81
MVRQKGNPRLYYLSIAGVQLARELDGARNKSPSVMRQRSLDPSEHGVNLVASSTPLSVAEKQNAAAASSESAASSPPARKRSRLDALSTTGSLSWEVVCLVDVREVRDASALRGLLEQLRRAGVVCETAPLPLGDFAWVVRPVSNVSSSQGDSAEDEDFSSTRSDIDPSQWFLLSCIVERKTVNDLNESIADGRWEEQKFRLRQCGIPGVTYLIEGWGNDTHPAILQAQMMRGQEPGEFERMQNDISAKLCEAHVFDGFCAFRSMDDEKSRRFLYEVTRHFEESLFRTRLGMGSPCSSGRSAWQCSKAQVLSHPEVTPISYAEFTARTSKSGNLRIADIFAKMLMQLPGVNDVICAAIVENYPTARALYEAYERCETHAERTDLLTHVTYDAGGSGGFSRSSRGDGSDTDQDSSLPLSQSQDGDSLWRRRERSSATREKKRAGKKSVPKGVSARIADFFFPA